MKNVFEAADTRQKQAKKRSLCVINEHFEPVFNTVAATQIVFQQPAKCQHPRTWVLMGAVPFERTHYVLFKGEAR
mgnify:CR=1 FL=1